MWVVNLIPFVHRNGTVLNTDTDGMFQNRKASKKLKNCWYVLVWLICTGTYCFFIRTAWYHYGINTNDTYQNRQLPRLVRYNRCTLMCTCSDQHGWHVAVHGVLVTLTHSGADFTLKLVPVVPSFSGGF